MKKLFVFLSIVSVISIAATLITFFSTYKDASSQSVPVSSITDSRVGMITPSMDIKLSNGHTTKVKMNDEFWFVHDSLYGHPDGQFTLTKQTNIFGHVRYTADNLQY